MITTPNGGRFPHWNVPCSPPLNCVVPLSFDVNYGEDFLGLDFTRHRATIYTSSWRDPSQSYIVERCEC
jgi:hypothetical protein